MYNLASEVYSEGLHPYLNRLTPALWYNNLCKLPFQQEIFFTWSLVKQDEFNKIQKWLIIVRDFQSGFPTLSLAKTATV